MKDYRFIDWATQVYVAVVGLLVLVFHGDRVPEWPWLLLGHGCCLVLVHGLIRLSAAGRGGRVVAFLRAFYPILLYTAFYRETGLLNQMFVPEYLDPWFMRLDQQVFGFQPCLELMERFPQRWVAELMYGSYFSYYFMIGGVGLTLLIRNRAHFDHFVTVVSFVFYLCYLTYIFLPVMGPRIFFGSQFEAFVVGEHVVMSFPPDLAPVQAITFPETVRAGWFYNVVIWVYRHFEAEGAAFPSSHVAVCLVTLYFTWRYLPRLRWIHTFLAAGLCVSTVYCRYHYGVDVLAGILVAAVLLPVGNRLHGQFNVPPQVPGNSGRPGG